MEVPLFKSYWDESDVDAVSRAIRRGMHWANGPEIGALESEVAGYVGAKHGVAFASGTSALHAVLLALGVGPGDEVVVPSFTFISTANAVVMCGATPVFADIETETYGLDPAAVEAAITPRTKAVVPVHYAGRACRIDVIAEVCLRRGVLLVEDAAESLGATCRGRNVGTFGDAAMFSFCSNKVISTGEGGAIVTDSAETAAHLRLLRSHGRDDEAGDYFASTASFDYVTLGYNYRMPTMVAALGLAQMAKVEQLIGMRRAAGAAYAREFADAPSMRLPADRESARHVFQLYTVELSEEQESRRSEIQATLKAEGVASKVYFDPVHLTTYYRESHGGHEGQLPVTETASRRVLSLPMYAGLDEDSIAHVAAALKRALGA